MPFRKGEVGLMIDPCVRAREGASRNTPPENGLRVALREDALLCAQVLDLRDALVARRSERGTRLPRIASPDVGTSTALN